MKLILRKILLFSIMLFGGCSIFNHDVRIVRTTNNLSYLRILIKNNVELNKEKLKELSEFISNKKGNNNLCIVKKSIYFIKDQTDFKLCSKESILLNSNVGGYLYCTESKKIRLNFFIKNTLKSLSQHTIYSLYPEFNAAKEAKASKSFENRPVFW